MTANGTHAANVEVLTAEVRVLMVGSRQVTLSVARQLDEVKPDDVTPFGRVRTGTTKRPWYAAELLEVVGAGHLGDLVRSSMHTTRCRCCPHSEYDTDTHRNWRCRDHAKVEPRLPEDSLGRALRIGEGGGIWAWESHPWVYTPKWWDDWKELPLIVLAGLR